jgi:hypothetical protein
MFQAAGYRQIHAIHGDAASRIQTGAITVMYPIILCESSSFRALGPNLPPSSISLTRGDPKSRSGNSLLGARVRQSENGIFRHMT